MEEDLKQQCVWRKDLSRRPFQGEPTAPPSQISPSPEPLTGRTTLPLTLQDTHPHNRETVNTHSLTYLHIHHRNIRTFWNTKKTPTFFLLLILLLLKYLLKLFSSSSSSSSSSVSSFWSSSFCCCCHKYLLLPSPYHSLVFCLTTSTPLLLLFFYFIFSCSRSPSSLSTVFGSYFGPQHSTNTDNQAKTKRTHILTSHIYWLVTHTTAHTRVHCSSVALSPNIWDRSSPWPSNT